jgi:D-alanyl-D-alanine carboxypeptidase (penicillin-binding protein 5/6)
MSRWWGAIGLAGMLLAGCGGSAAVVSPPEAVEDVAFAAVATAEPEREPTPAAPTLTPTRTPTSREAPLQPSISAVPPMLREGRPVPAVDASAVIVMDEASGAVLWEQNADARLAPASLTKIATAVVALQKGDFAKVVEVDVDSRAMPGSTVMGLVPGDRFSLQDLLYGVMLPSGNDAALAVGRAVSGTDGGFVWEMNTLVAKLGLRDTHFANPHGLGNTNHYTSAYDLAALARYAMSVEGFAPLSTTRSWTASGSRDIRMSNLNTFLGSYPGADGMKVGYTRRAGHTLVASATRNGHRVYVVLLNAPQSKADAAKLLDWAFSSHVWPPP